MSEFNRVGLIAWASTDLVVESLRTVEQFLRKKSVEVVLETKVAALLNESAYRICDAELLGDATDLVIAVGGDGNILGAGRYLASSGVPLLGINRGRLGFLADVSPDEIELRIGEVLEGEYTIEEHFLLEGRLDDQPMEVLPCALNEVIVHSATMARMIQFDLFINDVFVYNQFSDGLIVSSPTGSTAYALSAGGPIMHPSIDAMVLIPMFPHSLNSRPLVVPGNSELRIEIGSKYGGSTLVSFDSQLEYKIEPGQQIRNDKQPEQRLWLPPPGHSFYGVCRSKLQWANRPGQPVGTMMDAEDG